MLVPPGPFAPRISYGLRPFAEWNGIVVCAVAHGVISPSRSVAEWNGIVVCAAAHGGISPLVARIGLSRGEQED